MKQCIPAFVLFFGSMVGLSPGATIAKAHAAPGNASCMVGTKQSDAGGTSYTILVPENQVSAMEARGFVAQDCSGKETSAPKYRDEIRKLAETAPAPVKTRFAEIYGAGPGELCELATAAISQ